VKVEEKKETPDLLSLQIRFVCGISKQIPQISPQIWQKSYILEVFFKKTVSPIYRNGGTLQEK
jgi:hypothetical protein